MRMAARAPYGSWSSPIRPADVVRAGRRLGSPALAPDGAVWWLEGRPEEGGRAALMRCPPGGEPREATLPTANVRSRAHEYGGGSWLLVDECEFLYVEFFDQRLYRQRLGGEPLPLTPEPERPAALRYADMRVDPARGRVICVREAHPGDGAEPRNEIVSVPLDGSGEVTVLAGGRDFYSYPRISPDGAWLAWTCWDHPNMPWDGTELWLAPLDDPGDARLLAGGPAESVFQPEWDPEGRLHFVSDRDGWWNLYRAGDPAAELSGEQWPVVQLTEEKADLGHPQWLFGGATYAFLADGTIVAVRTERGTERLYALEPGAWGMTDLGLPYTSFGFPVLAARGSRVAFVACGPTEPTAVVVYDAATRRAEAVRPASEEGIDPEYVPRPRPIEFPTGDGETAYGFFYPPTNPGFEGPEGELPPLLVFSHGGPTSHATPEQSPEIAFWTSRGIGVVDVNYRGSSGHGRAYRERLRGNWGVVDWEDCVAAALHLARSGEADRERLAIRGGSAGGYATLCALVFGDAFAAGASYYGVADAETLARDTHKFESRYLDGLIGPYPERADLYRERSPIHHVERLRTPVILFQGLEDEIVPPSQAEAMAAALRRNGVPSAYLAFPGEQHGFRRAETEIRCLEAELAFYGRVLGFQPADDLAPLPIR